MNDVIGKVTDVHRVLAYSGRKISRWFLQMGLVALAAGAVLLYIQPDFSAFEWFMLALTLTVGAASTLYGLVRLWVPGKPMLLMSPAGLRLHFDFLKTMVIPWHEVRGVDTTDIKGEFRGTPVLLTGVTVVLVSRKFYDRRIHVDFVAPARAGLGHQLHPQGRHGADRAASRGAVRLCGGAAHGGRGALAGVPQSTGPLI